jgi:MYXO-CTERM domain-containing protein
VTPCLESFDKAEPWNDNWKYGDCDGDGYSNEEETLAGCDMCDATQTPEEGPCTPDVALDAGPDAVVPDAGTADARTADAGRSGATEAGFRGSGGCACSTTGEGPLFPDAPFGVALLLFFTTSRRAGRGS